MGQATGLQAQPNFSDHLFCIWGAHWTTDKMFCDLGNLLETNCRVQVQCNWTAGCPVKWGKSDTAQAGRMKQEFISQCRTCTVLCSHREFTHRQKHVCLLVICRHKPSLCILCWWVCPHVNMQMCLYGKTIYCYKFNIWERLPSSLRHFPPNAVEAESLCFVRLFQ